MAIPKKISMGKHYRKIPEGKSQNWWKAYLGVRDRTAPVQQKPQVIDETSKQQREDKQELRRKKHDWKRGEFDD